MRSNQEDVKEFKLPGLIDLKVSCRLSGIFLGTLKILNSEAKSLYLPYLKKHIMISRQA